jgi:hypothetical protein
MMSYQHLDDAELIHYALLDAPVGSLAHILATRYETNVTVVRELEESHALEFDDLELLHSDAAGEWEADAKKKDAQIAALEKEIEMIDRALLE